VHFHHSGIGILSSEPLKSRRRATFSLVGNHWVTFNPGGGAEGEWMS
jgi:hypothetical protein